MAEHSVDTTETVPVTKLRRAFAYAVYNGCGTEHLNYQSRNVYGTVEGSRDSNGIRIYSYDYRGLPVMVEARFGLWIGRISPI